MEEETDVPEPDVEQEAPERVRAYQDLIDQGRQQTPLRLALDPTTQPEPNKAKEIIRLSQQTGLDRRTVELAQEFAQQQAVSPKEQEYRDLLDRAPKTAAWLEDRFNAAATRNDREKLAKLEEMFRKVELEGPLYRPLSSEELGRSIVQGTQRRWESLVSEEGKLFFNGEDNWYTMPIRTPEERELLRVQLQAAEAETRTQENEFIGSKSKLSAGDVLSERPLAAVPLLGQIFDLLKASEKRLREGRGTPEDVDILIRAARMEAAARRRGLNVGAKATEFASGLSSFIGELWLTGGAGAAVRQGIVKGATGLGIRAIGKTAEIVTQTALSQGVKVAANTLIYGSPESQVTQNERGELQLQMSDDKGGRVVVPFLQAMASSLVDVGSAHIPLNPIYKFWAKTAANPTTEKFALALAKDGIKGVLSGIGINDAAALAKQVIAGGPVQVPTSIRAMTGDREALEDVGLQVAGFGALSALHTSLEYKRAKAETVHGIALSYKDWFKDAGEIVKSMETQGTHPEIVQDVLKTQVQDTNAAYTMVDPHDFHTFYEQRGINPYEYADELTGRPGLLNDALNTHGAKLPIPTEVFLTKIAATDAGAFFQGKATLDPNIPKVDVAKQRIEEIDKQQEAERKAKEEAKKAKEDAIQGEAMSYKEMVPEAPTLEENLAKDIEAIGKTKEEASVFGKLIGSFFRILAPKGKTTPEALAEKYGPVFQKGEQAQREGYEQPTKPLAPVFFSKLQKTVEAKMPASAPVEQVRGIIKDLKPEEIKWSEIDDYLKDKKTVSKEELLGFLKLAQLQVKEVMKGATAPPPDFEPKKVNVRDKDEYQWEAEYNGKLLPIGKGVVSNYPEAIQYAVKYFRERSKDEKTRYASQSPTKFSKYTLPGGESYRELLLTMPQGPLTELQGDMRAIKLQDGSWWVSNNDGDDLTKGTFPTREGAIAAALKNINSGKIPWLRNKGGFRSSHFEEPNVLAHVRFNDRTDAEGKRVLFVEELQSDWHQQGRRKGYQGEGPGPREIEGHDLNWWQAEYERRASAANAAEAQAADLLQKALRKAGLSKKESFAIYRNWWSPNPANNSGRAEAEKIVPDAVKEFDRIRREASEAHTRAGMNLDTLRASAEADKGTVPNAPFKKTWHEFALKRMVRYAAEHGYDKIAWTTGEQQAERYDLSKHLDRIEYEPIKDPADTYELVAYGKDGKEIIREDEIKIDRVEELVGKDVAEKIQKGEGEKRDQGGYRDWRAISGLDLKVGGEGMKGFYDEMLPAFANKFGKKFGAKVESTRVKLGEFHLDKKDNKAAEDALTGALWDALWDAKLTKEEIKFIENNWGRGGREKAMAVAPEAVKAYEAAYDRAHGADVPSLPITPALKKAALEEGFSMFQPGEDSPRGEYVPPDVTGKQAIIRAYKSSDPSTLGHEPAHLFLDIMADVAALPESDQQLKDDFGTFLKWRNVESPEAWRNMTLDEKRPHHEAWAEMYEQWLWKGKAPSAKLQAIFRRFRQWLSEIYSALKGKGLEIPPEIEAVFQRMHATEAEITAANMRAERIGQFMEGLPGFAQTPKEAEEFAALRASAHEAAVAKLEQRTAEKFKEHQADQFKTARETIKKEVTAEIDARREIKALAFLKDGTNPDGSPLPENTPAFKLSREAVREFYPSMDLTSFPKGVLDKPFPEGVGIHPDRAAEELGFSSGDELLKEIVSLDRDRAIDIETDARMALEINPQIEAMQEEAFKAIHTDEQAKLDAYEVEWVIRNRPTKFKELLKDLEKNTHVPKMREYAREKIADQNFREIDPRIHEDAERGARNAAREALFKGDWDGYVGFKNRAILNAELYRAATEGRAEIKAIQEIGAEFAYKDKRKTLFAAGDEYLAQSDAVLERYSFKNRSEKQIKKLKSLEKFADDEENASYLLDVPERLLDEARTVHWKDAKLSELRDVRDLLTKLEKNAELKNHLRGLQSKREFGVDKAQAIETIKANGKKREKPANSYSRQEERKRGWKSVNLSPRNPASLIREMDGYKDGGFLQQLILRPANEAGAEEAARTEKSIREIGKLSDEFTAAEQLRMNRLEFIPEIKGSLTRWDRMQVAATMGQEGARQRFLDGNRWNEEALKAITTGLTEKEWAWVRGVHEYLGTYRPEVEKSIERRTGLPAKMVKAEPIETPYGTQEGGYFPFKYNSRESGRVNRTLEEEAAERARRAAGIRSTTQHGYTEERRAEVKQPLRIDMGVLTAHLREVNHDLAWGETLRDLNRLLGDKDVQETIRDYYGDQVYRQLTDWLNDIAVGERPAMNIFETGANHIRRGASTAALAMNSLQAITDMSGFTQGAARIGVKWAWQGAKDFFGSPTKMQENVEWVHENSNVMRLRSLTLFRELNEIRLKTDKKGDVELYADYGLDKLTGGKVDVRDLNDGYFWLMTKAQMAQEIPLWMGAFEKAKFEHPIQAEEGTAAYKDAHAKWVSIADQAILDTFGGGQIKDLPPILKGHPIAKLLFGTFYSFTNRTLVNMMESLGRAKGDYRRGEFGVKSAARLGADFLLLYSLPAAIVFGIKAALSGDDRDLGSKFVRDQIAQVAGSIPLAREGVPAIQGHDYSGPAGLRFFAQIAAVQKQASEGRVDWHALNQSAGILFHYPALAVQRFFDGIIALIEGRSSNPLAPLFGAPKK